MKILLVVGLISSSLLLTWCFQEDIKPKGNKMPQTNIQSWVIQNQIIEVNSWILEKSDTWNISENQNEDDSWILVNHIKKFNQTDFNKIEDSYTKDLLTYYYQDLKKKRNTIENNQNYESLDWKLSTSWDWKFIHPMILTIENKKTWERNNQEVAYTKKWQEGRLQYSEKCSKLKVCNDSEIEEEIINNLDVWYDAYKPYYEIFANEYIIVKGFINDRLYKIPEIWPINFSNETNIIVASRELETKWNSPLLLVREWWASPDIPLFPCANLLHKEDLNTKLSWSRCDLLTLSWIDQFSYNGKLVVFVHATNQQDNSTEWKYYPKNLDEYIKQEGQYLPAETKLLHGEWPRKNSFYIYDLSTGKFESQIEFPWDFNF